jgi:(1->4)-alpha-D-glucan 1-alpha-D-glucosylmutase
VDGRNEDALLSAWHAFSGLDRDFDELLWRCKKLIIETSLFSELEWLSGALHALTQGNRRRCDFTRNRLRIALAEVAGAFPVYRTYLRAGEATTAMDRQHIDWALAAAGRRLGGTEAAVLGHLREVLLGEGEAADMPQDARQRFLERWQQFTAPVMAKAMEDTLFYRYVPLLSLNEVGGDPRGFGTSVAAFHAANTVRQRYRPHSLLATSTHDSKRSEDLRARLDVLSEMPAQWEDLLLQLSGWAQRYRTLEDGETWPSGNDIWLLFQTLVGLWPLQPPDENEREQLRQRVQAYMRKAVREAKLHTTWLCPATHYEAALERYIDGVLRPASPNPFADELQRFVARIAPFGLRNSLAQLALKCTAPGVPDLYQGCEQWSFHLVDPDNRRPVDFARLAAGLEQARALYRSGWPTSGDWRALWQGAADGRIKQAVTWRLLQLRRERADLFREAGYVPLTAEGPAEDHAVAYARVRDAEAVIVVAARLTHTLCGGDDAAWDPGLWEGTRIRCGNEVHALRRVNGWRDWLTGTETRIAPEDDGTLDLRQVFAGAAGLPFAVLVPIEESP